MGLKGAPLARHIPFHTPIPGYPGEDNVDALLRLIAGASQTWPELAGEVGVVDRRWPYGHPHRYGAVGNEVANDRVPVQLAIDNARPSAAGFRNVLLEGRFKYYCGVADPSAQTPWSLTLRDDVNLVGFRGRGRLLFDGPPTAFPFLMGNYYNSLWGYAEADKCSPITIGSNTIVIPKPREELHGRLLAPAYAWTVGQLILVKSEGGLYNGPLTLALEAKYSSLRFMDLKTILSVSENSSAVTITTVEPFDADVPDPGVCPAIGTRVSTRGTGPMNVLQNAQLRGLDIECIEPCHYLGGPNTAMKNCQFDDLRLENCMYVGGNSLFDVRYNKIRGSMNHHVIEFAGNSRRCWATDVKGFRSNTTKRATGTIMITERCHNVHVSDFDLDVGVHQSTLTTAAFVQPSYGSTVDISVESSAFISSKNPDLVLVIGDEFSSTYEYVSAPNATTLRLRVPSESSANNLSNVEEPGALCDTGARVTLSGFPMAYILDSTDCSITDGAWSGHTPRQTCIAYGLHNPAAGAPSAELKTPGCSGHLVENLKFRLTGPVEYVIQLTGRNDGPKVFRDCTTRGIRYEGPEPIREARVGGTRMIWDDIYMENGSMRLFDDDALPSRKINGGSFSKIVMPNGKFRLWSNNAELIGSNFDDLYSVLRDRDVRFAGNRQLGDKEWLALRRMRIAELVTTSTTFQVAYEKSIADAGGFKRGDVINILAKGYNGAAGELKIALVTGSGSGTETILATVVIPASNSGVQAWQVDGSIHVVREQAAAAYAIFFAGRVINNTAFTTSAPANYATRLATGDAVSGDPNLKLRIAYRTTSSGSSMSIGALSVIPVRPGVADIEGIE
jgi:hypothetical protein